MGFEELTFYRSIEKKYAAAGSLKLKFRGEVVQKLLNEVDT